jgi:DNA helicase-2/ATP-dependent DNA helicase PcrA
VPFLGRRIIYESCSCSKCAAFPRLVATREVVCYTALPTTRYLHVNTAVDREIKPYILRRPHEDSLPPKLSLAYERALNAQQLAAVTAPDGPALVIAGAGSGKTRTLVYRLAYLIDRGIDPSSILLLTFTRKAAEEMLARAGGLIGARAERVTGGTFHSVANKLLRRFGRSIGLEPGFTILDRGDAEDLINLLRSQLGLADKDKRFPRKATIAEMFSKCENTLATLEEVLLGEFSHFSEHLQDLLRLKQTYHQVKRDRQLADYDDLLVRLRQLLGDDESARETISSRYRWVLVDEYQDTNRLQADLIRRLATTHQNVMAVGDDSQSIYAFRGATFRNIMEFPSLFPGTTIYKLEENYRSTQPILNLANGIIQGAAERYSKHLFTRKLEGPLPVLVQAVSENAQSRFVAQRILELREEGVPLNEIAVLFRSSFHSFDLELELARRDLPFVKRGGMKFIETAHVKDLLAHLRVLANPLDAVSWHRILLLVEGVGTKKAQSLIASFINAPRPFHALRATCGRASSGLRELAHLLEETVQDTTRTPAEQVNEVYTYYLPILKDQYDDYPKRIRDLEHLYAMAERYERMQDFLADLALEPPDQSVFGVETDERGVEQVVLSTIHSAKGLEWRCVFVIWTVDGRFPSAYAFLTDEELEEERRLFYVAVTRAKQHLLLTYPINVYDKATGAILSRPSRFLDNVAPSLLDAWALVEEAGSSGWG